MTSHHRLSGVIPTPLSRSLSSAGGSFEAKAEEEKAECSAVPPDEKRQQNVGNISHWRRAAIDRLPNEMLEEIFRFDSLDPFSFHQSELWDWHRLVHVCRRWRYIIFNASHSLELRLFCTYGTPVKKNLDCWPALPIVLQYLLSPNPSPPPVDEDDVMTALQHPDRVCTMKLTVTTSLLEKLTTLARNQFPVLECLELIGGPDKEPIILNEFLVGPFPSLRILRLTRVVFPALQRFLPFTKNLVSLRLQDLPYLTPAAIRNVFPGMTRLENLHLSFLSPISRTISESGRNDSANVPPCRAVLPALEFVQFCGTSEDLECLLSSTEAPVLQAIDITFFNQATIFDASQFVQFLSRSKTQRSHDVARLYCLESEISFALTPETGGHYTMLRVRCMSLDWQLSCMAEICANLFPIVSDVRHLHIDASLPFPSEHDDMDPLPLLDLFRPFSNVTMLFLAETVALYVKYALKQEVAMGVLPAVQSIVDIMPPSPFDFFIDGYIAQSFGPKMAERYLCDLLKVSQQQCISSQFYQAIPRSGGVTFVVGDVATRQPPPPLMQDHNGLPLWLFDYSTAPMCTVVPQELWSPQNGNDVKQFVTEAELQMPIFFTQENGQLGLSLYDATNGRCHALVGAHSHAYLGGKTTTFIRIKWPGYCEFKRQFQIRDETAAHNPITVAKFAHQIGRSVATFIRGAVPDQNRDASTQLKSWMFGPSGIDPAIIRVIGAIHVSAGSWMPILQLDSLFII